MLPLGHHSGSLPWGLRKRGAVPGGMGETFVCSVSLLSAAPAAVLISEIFLVFLRGYSLLGGFLRGPSARLSPWARVGRWRLVRSLPFGSFHWFPPLILPFIVLSSVFSGGWPSFRGFPGYFECFHLFDLEARLVGGL